MLAGVFHDRIVDKLRVSVMGGFLDVPRGTWDNSNIARKRQSPGRAILIQYNELDCESWPGVVALGFLAIVAPR